MITLLSSKIELEIADHFEENIEIGKQEYECKFTFDNAEIIVPYYPFANPIYKNSEIGATKNGTSYCDKDRDHFRIRRVDGNPCIPIDSEESEYSKEEKLKQPKKKTFQQEIDSIIEHEQNKLNERDDRLNICDDYKDHM